MHVGVTNLAVLLGLAGLALPILIHLLTRRRHEVVEWGAMQFLAAPSLRRQRRSLDEFWLLLIRLGIVALIVAALAGPFLVGPLIASWTRPQREVVLILDASASMDLHVDSTKTPWQLAKEEALAMLDELQPGDRASLVLATHPVEAIADFTTDLQALRQQIESLPEPRGSADGPAALLEAWKRIQSTPAARERLLWLASDFQQWGWTDEASLERWHSLGHHLANETAPLRKQADYLPVRLRAVSLKPEKKPADLPVNFGLKALKTSREVVGVGQKFTVSSELFAERHRDSPLPANVGVEVDGKKIGDIALSANKEKRWPLAYDLRLSEPGLHVLRFSLPSFPDALPADNHQERVVEVVPEIPVLLVDGSAEPSPKGSTFFLRKAFADPVEPKKVSLVVPRTVTAEAFDVGLLTASGSVRPRVVILADVPNLREEQWRALEKYVEAGGGLWIILGPRMEDGKRAFNDRAFRQGEGLSPAKLEKIAGKKDVRLDARRFLHPGLEMFKAGSLGQVSVAKAWSVTPGRHASSWALLSNGEPWLMEQVKGRGKVLLSTVPMDRSWEGELAPSWEFPVLVHEIMYALAEVRAGQFNLAEGQPLTLAPERLPGWDATTPLPVPVSWRNFRGIPQRAAIAHWPGILPPLGPTGTYALQVASMNLPIVVGLHPRESELVYAMGDDWKKVADLLPMVVEESAPAGDEAGSWNLWWVLFGLVIVFLCVESWLSRRILKRRGLA